MPRNEKPGMGAGSSNRDFDRKRYQNTPFPCPPQVGNHRLPCPQCDRGARDTALSVTVEDGGPIVWLCFRCGFRGAAGHKWTPGEIPVRRRKPKPRPRAKEVFAATGDPSPDHPYLVRKGIRPHFARQTGDRLALPLIQPGQIVGVQYIGPDGSKRFLKGSTIVGAYYFLGDPTLGARIIIAEGFATAASLHEATGDAVLVAYAASNLKTVAQGWKNTRPDAEFIIAGDDDPAGRKAAQEAARAVGGRVALPVREAA